MGYRLRRDRLSLVAMALVIVFSGLPGTLAAADPPATAAGQGPAGQMCPAGTYVIGFDSAANIICSGVCGNGALDSGETCDDGNTAAGDGCSAACQSEGVKSAAAVDTATTVDTVDAVAAGAATSALVQSETPPSIAEPLITDVEPSSVIFGTSRVKFTVSGTGFNENSVIIFDGSTYEPEVNSEGTQLILSIATGDLSIGRYALKVSNGPGLENTRKKAVVIY